MYKPLALLALLPTAFAHFQLQYPTPLGTDDDNSATGPCGGYPVAFGTNDTSVTVGGFAVALRRTHPQANWFYRYSLNTAEPFNWVNILPQVRQSGLGSFCLPQLSVPQNLTGKQAIIQVLQEAVDGNLYACAAVKFVQGSTSQAPGVCTNSTGVTAQITNINTLNSTNATSTTTATTSSSTAKASGAGVHNVVGGLLALVPAGFLLL